MYYATKRHTWVVGRCTILLLLPLVCAGCGDSISNCGNGLIDDTEECDGINLAGESCVTQGFAGGTLGCLADCSGLDTIGCTVPVCGDNTAEGTEVCDGTDLAGEGCVSQGFNGGTLACLSDCSGFDTSSCTGGCGNDVIEDGEICDGTDVGGGTCADLGFTGGTLACNATCDNVDATACAGGPPGWTCVPEYYGTADGCDCGCGVIDPDCADSTVASCEYCGEAGSCSPIFADCPGDIDPVQNWLCGG